MEDIFIRKINPALRDYYSRGSLFETKTWLRKSFNRKLVKEKDYLTFTSELEMEDVIEKHGCMVA